MKKWTVMIYLAGDNNLSDEMIWALKEMYRVGTDGRLNVVAQIDPSALGTRPRIYDIGKLEQVAGFKGDKDGLINLHMLNELLVQDMSTINQAENSADPRTLAGFLAWTLANPAMKAKHYMLILSGHGSGATGGFLQDSNPPGKLTIPEFGEVLEKFCSEGTNHMKVDILGLDCCSMSMAEVAHQVHPFVDYLVGAEGFEQNAGWPYHRLFESLLKGLSPIELAKEMVRSYYFYYSDYLAAGVSADQAVIRLGDSWRQRLIDPFKRLSGLLQDALKKQAVQNALVLAHWSAQSFNYEQHIDLYDFCLRLDKYLAGIDQNALIKEIRGACKSITGSPKGAKPQPIWKDVVPLSLYTGPDYQHAHGLSVYFPWSEYSLNYDDLAFANDTGWGDFLKSYLVKTCRDITGGAKGSDLIAPRYGDGSFVGIGGWPVYRGGGPYSARGGGPYSARGGGPYSARGGGPYSARGGGPYSARGGGPYSARGGGPYSARFGAAQSVEDVARLCSMKNFPAAFHQPYPEGQVLKRIFRRRAKSIIKKMKDSRLKIAESLVEHSLSAEH